MNVATRIATFEYLGVAGWLIRRGNESVLTAPFFSNPRKARLPFRMAPDAAVVQEHMQKITGGVADVCAVLAGHAHYDHIMDLPEVVKYLPAGVRVFGGESVCNSLGRGFIRQCVAITHLAGTRHHAAVPFGVANGIRVRAYLSEHAPHLGNVKFLCGHYGEMREHVPERPVSWVEGEPLAFLIDFLGANDEVELRVYYNDTSPSFPRGLPDEPTLQQKQVDVAILAVASFEEQYGYPEKYVEVMDPRHVLLGHWEDFFKRYDDPIEPRKEGEVDRFLARMPGREYTLPARHAVIPY